MKIIEELKQRSEHPGGEVKIELKLYNIADELEKKARHHLKRISTVLREFDIHDERHSENVVSNIEKLLAEKVKALSVYNCSCFTYRPFFMTVQWLHLTTN